MLNGQVKVVIADDHDFIRMGVRRLLEKSSKIQIVGEACNGLEAILLVDRYHPDVLILDLQMPVMDGLEVLDKLHSKKPDLIILILSASNDQDVIAETMSKGAWSYYLKDEAPTRIVKAVQQAVLGNGKGYRPAMK